MYLSANVMGFVFNQLHIDLRSILHHFQFIFKSTPVYWTVDVINLKISSQFCILLWFPYCKYSSCKLLFIFPFIFLCVKLFLTYQRGSIPMTWPLSEKLYLPAISVILCISTGLCQSASDRFYITFIPFVRFVIYL